MTNLKFATMDTDAVKKIELTHRGRRMEISYRNGMQFGHETVTGLITWVEKPYSNFQSFHVGRKGDARELYIAFDVPVNFSKTMRKEVGKKLEDIIIKGEGLK